MAKVFNLKHTWKRNKQFLLINIFGLTIGLTISILLFLYVMNELSFDKHFANYQRITTLNSVINTNDEIQEASLTTRSAIDVLQSVPNIEAVAQLLTSSADVEYNKIRYTDNIKWLADPDFLKIFKMKFLVGDETALSKPNTIVLTESEAKKIFGKEDPLGKVIMYGNAEHTVTAVVKDLPKNTHFHFDILARMPENINNGSINFYVYYLIAKNADFEKTCEEISKEYSKLLVADFEESFSDTHFGSKPIPLEKIHFNSGVSYGISSTNTIKYLIMLSALALFILILAITNFTNLFLIQSNKRSTEIGIHKVNGATRKDIAVLFFNETSIVVVLSFIVGILLSRLLLPSFESLLNVSIEHSIYFSWIFIVSMIVLILLVTLLSGAYPSFYLSWLDPIKIIRKKGSSGSNKKFTGMVSILQSVITIVLLACILVIMLQTNYMRKMPIGYNPDNIMVVRGHFDKQYDAIKDRLMNLPDVKSVSTGYHVFGEFYSGDGFSRADKPEQTRMINTYELSTEACEQLGLELVAGEYLRESDSLRDVVMLNEAAVKVLGLECKLPMEVNMYGKRRVAGILKDFCYDQPGKEIMPMAIVSDIYVKNQITIKFKRDIDRLEANNLVVPIFKEFDPEFVMISTWMEDIYERKFSKITEIARVLAFSTVLALIIAIMGIVATHSASVNTRIKEIGIRKTLGSTNEQVVLQLSRRVFVQTLIAIIISIPIIIPIGNKLLETYTYHIELGTEVFILPAIAQLVIVLLTTLYISLKAASRNPVDSLHYE